MTRCVSVKIIMRIIHRASNDGGFFRGFSITTVLFAVFENRKFEFSESKWKKSPTQDPCLKQTTSRKQSRTEKNRAPANQDNEPIRNETKQNPRDKHTHTHTRQRDKHKHELTHTHKRTYSRNKHKDGVPSRPVAIQIVG